MKLRDNIIWITGASSGIGEALAYEACRRGAKVIISARRESVQNEVKSKCSHPENVKVLALDLEKTEELTSKVEEAQKLFGKVDILVNNGGLSQRSLTRDTGLDVDERLMKINYIGSVGLTKAALPEMLKRGSGHIVTVSSMVGKFGTPMRSSYAATKHALHGFMDSLRAEEARNGLVVTMVCPGFVATDVSKNALTADGSAQGTMDAQTATGIRPAAFVKKMADAIENDVPEIAIAGLKEKFGLFLTRFFPGLFRKMIQKTAVT
jgi:dehydrogenase/reductase SDR family protein 7B